MLTSTRSTSEFKRIGFEWFVLLVSRIRYNRCLDSIRRYHLQRDYSESVTQAHAMLLNYCSKLMVGTPDRARLGPNLLSRVTPLT
jgi:radical SAM superfamily enzyme